MTQVNKSSIQRYEEYVLGTYNRFPLTLTKGEGAWVWSDTGEEFLDFCMGIAVCSLGHCHPRLVEAVQKQAGRLMHASNLYYNEIQAVLAEEIVAHHVKIPGKVFFSNSGAEANDGLIKTSRRFGRARPQSDGTPRTEIISFTNSFHGRTLGSMAATGQAKIHEGFAPLLPDFKHLPFNELATVEESVGPSTVAILLEPVQGEGGVHVASAEFLRGIGRLCQEHDLLLLLDEVQAGFGRCGEAMAWRIRAPDLVPDGISWAKGMGGGVPIGSFWLSDRAISENGESVASLMGPGSHGSTYGGNPLVCAASLANLQEIRQTNLTGHVQRVSAKVFKEIEEWKLESIRETRGLGLLIGIELNPCSFPEELRQGPALHVVRRAMERGLLIVPAGPFTLRLLPPLNVTEEEVDTALRILKRVLEEV